MYIYIYTCIQVYIYTQYRYTNIHKHIYTYQYICICACTYTYGIHIHVDIRICVCIYTYVYVNAYVYTYMHMHIHTYTHVHTGVYAIVPPLSFLSISACPGSVGERELELRVRMFLDARRRPLALRHPTTAASRRECGCASYVLIVMPSCICISAEVLSWACLPHACMAVEAFEPRAG